MKLRGPLALRCQDRGAAAGLRELNAEAPEVHVDAHLAAQVALRRFDGCGRKRFVSSSAVIRLPGQMQIMHMGREPVCLKHCEREGCTQPWPCTCGACPACLGPGVFPKGGGAN